jgi:hypothetical protein
MSQLTPAASKWLRIGAVGIAAVGILAWASPVLTAAAEGALDLAKLGLFAAGAALVVTVLPAVGHFLDLKILQVRKAIAKAMSVEQLQQGIQDRMAKIRAMKNANASTAGQIATWKKKLVARRKEDPTHDLSKQELSVQRMEEYLSKCVTLVADAERKSELYKAEVERAIFDYEFAQEGKVILSAMSPDDQKAILGQILEAEAFKAISLDCETVFAKLDMELGQLELQELWQRRGHGRD